MLLSAVSVLVVAQSSSEIPEGLMNNPVYVQRDATVCSFTFIFLQDHSTCFGCLSRPSSEVRKIVVTATGTSHISR